MIALLGGACCHALAAAFSVGLPASWYEVVTPFRYVEARRFEAGWNRGADVRVNGPVRAVARGRVAFAGTVAGRGVVTVRVQTDSGPVVHTWTGVRPRVRPGQVVRPGDPIASAVWERVHIGAYDGARRMRYLPVGAATQPALVPPGRRSENEVAPPTLPPVTPAEPPRSGVAAVAALVLERAIRGRLDSGTSALPAAVGRPALPAAVGRPALPAAAPLRALDVYHLGRSSARSSDSSRPLPERRRRVLTEQHLRGAPAHGSLRGLAELPMFTGSLSTAVASSSPPASARIALRQGQPRTPAGEGQESDVATGRAVRASLRRMQQARPSPVGASTTSAPTVLASPAPPIDPARGQAPSHAAAPSPDRLAQDDRVRIGLPLAALTACCLLALLRRRRRSEGALPVTIIFVAVPPPRYSSGMDLGLPYLDVVPAVRGRPVSDEVGRSSPERWDSDGPPRGDGERDGLPDGGRLLD